MADERIIIELVSASRQMIESKGWHEIDGQCSVCHRFMQAVEAAEHTLAGGQAYRVCLNCGKYGEGDFCQFCGSKKSPAAKA